MLRNKNVTSKSCVVSKMNRIKIDTKRVECINFDTSKIQNTIQLNFYTKKEPQKLNGDLLDSIVRAVAW